eukprot:2546771-Alexandrium_andersonii.AAC.1
MASVCSRASTRPEEWRARSIRRILGGRPSRRCGPRPSSGPSPGAASGRRSASPSAALGRPRGSRRLWRGRSGFGCLPASARSAARTSRTRSSSVWTRAAGSARARARATPRPSAGLWPGPSWRRCRRARS